MASKRKCQLWLLLRVFEAGFKNTSHHCVHVYACGSQERLSDPLYCSYRCCESAVLWVLGTEHGSLWQQPVLLAREPSTSPAPRSAFLENKKVKQGMGTRKRPALVVKVYLLSHSSVSNLDALSHLLWTLFLGFPMLILCRSFFKAGIRQDLKILPWGHSGDPWGLTPSRLPASWERIPPVSHAGLLEPPSPNQEQLVLHSSLGKLCPQRWPIRSNTQPE